MGNLRIVLTPSAANPNVGDLYLDDSGQLEWIGGDITDEADYALMVLQRIRCRIMLIRGEWYLDQRIGTPWREKIWVKGVTADTVRAIIWNVTKTTPGVESVVKVEVELDSTSRTATMEIVAVTDLGTMITTDMLDEPMIIEVPNG